MTTHSFAVIGSPLIAPHNGNERVGKTAEIHQESARYMHAIHSNNIRQLRSPEGIIHLTRVTASLASALATLADRLES